MKLKLLSAALLTFFVSSAFAQEDTQREETKNEITKQECTQNAYGQLVDKSGNFCAIEGNECLSSTYILPSDTAPFTSGYYIGRNGQISPHCPAINFINTFPFYVSGYYAGCDFWIHKFQVHMEIRMAGQYPVCTAGPNNFYNYNYPYPFYRGSMEIYNLWLPQGR